MADPVGTDVLIIGAGPTGLTLGAEILRHGARCRVVELLDQPAVYSKAAVVHARTMEVFDQMGVVDEVLSRCKKVHGVNLYAGEKRVAHIPIDGMDTQYPHIYGMSQRHTEEVLAQYFTKLGGKIQRGTRLLSFTEDAEGIAAELEHAGGRRENVRAHYVAGCDGAHSRVREVLGIPFEGSSYEERLIQADVRIDWPTHMVDDEIITFLHPDGVLACFPVFADGRFRLVAMLEAGDEAEPTLESFQAIMDKRGIRGARVHDPAWMVAFRIHCKIVPEYRKNRAFLAGDAAHIHSPVGGQGMNTGIQDAYNLGWKLALAVRGACQPAVLDAYHAERHPIAKATLEATDSVQRHGIAMVTLRHPIAAGLRNQLLGFVTGLEAFHEKATARLSMLALNYRKSPIVSQDHPSLWSANVGVLGHASTEAPTLLDWATFGHAPGPGDRAGQVALPAESSGRQSLFDLLRGTKHALLLFDGAGATPEGYANLEKIARRARERFGQVLEVHVVLPDSRRPRGFAWDGSVVNDADGALHRRFGARSECLYVIRPDGYVAYRCQPAVGEKLDAYLESIFTS